MIEQSEYTARRRAIVEALKEHGHSVMLVSGLPNIRYLSGFTGSNGLMLLGQDEELLFSDPRYAEQARTQTRCRVQIVKGSLYAAAAKQVTRRRIQKLVFEQNRISYSAYSELSAHLGSAKLAPATGLVERLRMRKSDAEIRLIRGAVQIAAAAFEQAVRRVNKIRTEEQLAAELEYRMRLGGAEAPAFPTIVASAAKSALPHAQPDASAIQPNRLLLVDMGAVQSGYCSDMTRVLCPGRPTPEARRLYRAVREAQQAALDQVRAGASVRSVDRAARRVLAKHGYERQFVHSTGHGLGLEIHEEPRIGQTSKGVLEAGMTITIEPGAYIPGFGGVRIEDTVVVKEQGCEILTPVSKELLLS